MEGTALDNYEVCLAEGEKSARKIYHTLHIAQSHTTLNYTCLLCVHRLPESADMISKLSSCLGASLDRKRNSQFSLTHFNGG